MKAWIVDDPIDASTAAVVFAETRGRAKVHAQSTDACEDMDTAVGKLPPAQPEIIRCKDCKHNPKYEWFGCPMCHLSEKQRPETAWCWKAEKRTDERSD